jgi:hypothetical protein
MIYDFFTDKNKGMLTNYLSNKLNMPGLKLIDYVEGKQTLWKSHQELDKKFTFGYDGKTFNLYLTGGNKLGLLKTGYDLDFLDISDIEKELISLIREHKLNGII